MTTLGQRIKEARKLAGFTQSEAAQKCGLKLRAWQNYEHDHAKPSIEILEKFSNDAHISFEWLATGKDKSKASAAIIHQDKKALENIIITVERCLNDHDLELPPAKKAEMILWLYDEHVEKQQTAEQVAETASNVIKLMAG